MLQHPAFRSVNLQLKAFICGVKQCVHKSLSVVTLLGSAKRKLSVSSCKKIGIQPAGRKMGEAVLGHGNCNSLGRVQKLCCDVSGER